MTDREAMQLALDALVVAVQMDQLQGGEWDDMAHTAIAALRQALEQAEQAQPFCYHDGRNIVGKEFAEHSDVFPLYTAPPSKPWVSLTSEELASIVVEHAGFPTRQLAAIEAKLKEKNT